MHLPNTANLFRHRRKKVRKLLMYMKLVAIILLATALQVCAAGNAQTVTISKKKISLVRIFSEINKQTGYNFLYNDAWLRQARLVTIKADRMPLKEVLDICFTDQPLTYSIVEKTIVIKKREASAEQNADAPVPVKVSGTVTDQEGNPLAGVSITIKGQITGVTSDVNGNFSIEVPENATLEISYVAFQSQTIKISDGGPLNISLRKLANDLGEVVVVGYGKTTRGKNITSVTTMNAEKIANLGATSVGEALGGRVPGLIVTTSGGGVGKRPSISIRGGGTPVFVIDDIISSEFQFQTLNINDIENISFLKDGPATAIYGVAAGNGIVLVTTKKGAKNKLNVNYNFGHDLAKPAYLPKKISSYEYVSIVNKIDELEGNTGRVPAADVQKYKDQSDPLNFPNTDWQKLMLKDFAPQSHHNLSVSGGNKQMQYYASLGYLDQGTLYRHNTNWLKRYNYRMSVTGDFEKIGLKATLALYGLSEIRRDNLSSYSGNGLNAYFFIWSHIQNQGPTSKAFADLEHTKYANTGDHPLVETDPRSGYTKNEDRDLNGNLTLQWSVPKVKGLSLRGNGNLRQMQSFGKAWNTTAPQYAIGSSTPAQSGTPSLSLSSGTGYQYVLQGFADYTSTFGNHAVSGLLGYEEAYGYNENFNAARNAYVFNIDQLFAGPQATATNGGSSREEVRNAWLGRVRYDFKNKYYFEGSFRYDGNDLFPEDNRKGFFPAGAVGWIVSQEGFMKRLNNRDIINYLRARISYGSVGQVQRNTDGSPTIGYFSYIPGYGLGGGYVVGGVFQQSLNAPGIPSPDLGWFDQQSFNTGFDFASLNNKLSGSLDYFYIRTTGYLASPSSQGYADPLGTALPTRRSGGAFRRAGFDFGLKYTSSIGKLQYAIGTNFTKFNELWEVNPFEDSATLKNPYKTSYHQTGFFQTAYLASGLYQNSQEIINNPRLNTSVLAPGDIRYEDVNGDGKLDSEDLRRVGKATFPRVNYGFTADLNYGGLFLNMLWQGSGKRSIALGNVFRSAYSTGILYEFQTKDHWEPGLGNTQYPRLISGSAVNGGNNDVNSDFWIINAGYLRLKALQLGYNFKNLLAKNIKFVSDLRVTLSGTNLLTFSKIKDYGLDPETGSNNNYDYPTQKVYSLSVNVGF